MGLYKFRKELIEQLKCEEHEIIIAGPLGEYAEEFNQMGIKLIEIKLSRHGVNPFQELQLFKRYKRICI